MNVIETKIASKLLVMQSNLRPIAEIILQDDDVWKNSDDIWEKEDLHEVIMNTLDYHYTSFDDFYEDYMYVYEYKFNTTLERKIFSSLFHI